MSSKAPRIIVATIALISLPGWRRRRSRGPGEAAAHRVVLLTGERA